MPGPYRGPALPRVDSAVVACESHGMRWTLTFTLLIAMACGGKDKAAPATTTTAHAHEGHDEGDEHAGMSPEMTQFHELLRPRWHAEQGPARMKGACDAVPQFQSAGDMLAKATPPEAANADTWTAGTRALVAAITDLAAACKGTDNAAFETAFSKLHDAFHALMEAGATHGKGGGGTDGGGHDATGSASAPGGEHEHHHGGH